MISRLCRHQIAIPATNHVGIQSGRMRGKAIPDINAIAISSARSVMVEMGVYFLQLA